MRVLGEPSVGTRPVQPELVTYMGYSAVAL
jgi:hypothetical protein